jgi:hypothetical protein
MNLRDKAVNLEQHGVNDHVKFIGKQITSWIDAVSAGSMSKSEMRNYVENNVGGYENGAINASVLGIDDSVKTNLESIISEAKSFAAE